MKNILHKKIELLPQTPKENEIICSACGGIGWLQDDYGHLVSCTNPKCCNGIIRCCPDCGQPYKSYTTYCDNGICREKVRIQRQKDEINRENFRFKNAKKIKYDDAPNEIKEMVYSDCYDYNEGYSNDLEWVDNLEDVEKPKYVWATYKVQISIDAEDILENACSDLHEGAYEQLEDINELQDFLNEWCKKTNRSRHILCRL